MKRDLRILPELRLAQKGTCSDGHRLLCNEERLRSVPVRGRRELGYKLGYYERRLEDGSGVGYVMRRADDCLQAAIATCLGIPPMMVPDLRVDENQKVGVDPEEITRTSVLAMCRWAEAIGVQIMVHPTPPTSTRRWIGVLPRSGLFNDHCLVLSGRTIIHDPMVGGWGISSEKNFTDIEFGLTLEKE